MLETVSRTPHHPLTPQDTPAGVVIRCACGATTVGDDLADAAEQHDRHANDDEDPCRDRNR